MRDFIILGLSFQGLFFARALGDKPYNLHCIGRTPNDIGMFSKYGRKYIAPTGAELKKIIQRITKENAKEKPFAFIGDGGYLDIILAEYPEIFQHICVFGADIELLRILNSKMDVYGKLNNVGITVPEAFFLKDIAKHKVEFPVIAKWNTKEYRSKPIGKIKVISDVDEFNVFLHSIDIKELGEHIIIQEYIHNPGTKELGYGAYYENGNEVAGIIFRQKRQHPKGLTSFAFEVKDQPVEVIRKKLKEFLSNMKYDGFIEIDLLIDCKASQYYILDVNPRPWSSIRILEKKHPNIIDYVLKIDNKLKKNESKKPIGFVRLFNDLKAIFFEFKQTKKINVVLEPLRDYKNYDCIVDEFDKKDLKPLWICIKRGVKSIFIRNTQGQAGKQRV